MENGTKFHGSNVIVLLNFKLHNWQTVHTTILDLMHFKLRKLENFQFSICICGPAECAERLDIRLIFANSSNPWQEHIYRSTLSSRVSRAIATKEVREMRTRLKHLEVWHVKSSKHPTSRQGMKPKFVTTRSGSALDNSGGLAPFPREMRDIASLRCNARCFGLEVRICASRNQWQWQCEY